MSEQVQIGLARIYIKDLSFESPQAPTIFRRNFQPEIKLTVEVQPKAIEDSLFEVTLELNVEARDPQGVCFIVELEQAGLFEIKNASEAQLDHILTVFCPGTLFPYARQAVDQALGQGGFPPVMLAPINFEAIRKRHAPNGQASAPNEH